jgi:hypothetical protein
MMRSSFAIYITVIVLAVPFRILREHLAALTCNNENDDPFLIDFDICQIALLFHP